ncbi:MAG: hypothetical protein AAF433_22550 [Bacteroidota bacterium]
MEATLTLRQGLEQFYQEYEHHLSHQQVGISSEAKSFFTSHDIAHVLFGCDISFFGEGSVKIWTIFGTTLGFWKHLREYKKANAFTLSRNFSLGHIIGHIFKLLYSIPLLIIRARRMRKRWPWSDYEAYLDQPIGEIREAFNIQVLK